MSTEKQHWRKALYTIKQYTSPRAGELERELDSMRSDHRQLEQRARALLSERERVREELHKAQQEVESIRAELDMGLRRHERLSGEQRDRLTASRQQLETAHRRRTELERELADRDQRITGLQAAVKSHRVREQELRRQLEQLGERLSVAEQAGAVAGQEKRELAEKLDRVRSALQQSRVTDGRQISRLEQRMKRIDAERQAAERRAQRLETALETAAFRDSDAAGKVRALESKLDEQRRNYEADLHALRETLARVQSEQRGAVARGTLQGAAVHGADHRPVALTAPGGGQRWRGNWTMLAAGLPLLLGALASATTFWDEGRNGGERLQLMTPLADSVQSDGVASAPGDNTAAVTKLANSAEEKKSRPRAIRRRPIEHRHWGPALFMDQQAGTRTRGVSFDPLVEQQQRDLMDLGFDLGQARADGLKGRRTEQALSEFEALYLPQNGLQAEPSDAELAVIIGNYAALARSDEQKFNVDRGVLAAIRLSSVRTGVDFSYLMELAAAESNFNPASKAVGSSATGLFQFTRETWLRTVKRHGDNYGLGIYTAQIEYYVDRAGRRRPMVRDPEVLEHLLELRHNPRVSAMMAAESVRDNLDRLMFSFDREPGRTELYLAHFLGVDGAISFLELLDNNPDKMAGDVFPGAAQSNRSIFHSQPCRPRTITEIYDIFDSKFNTSRYEDFNPG